MAREARTSDKFTLDLQVKKAYGRIVEGQCGAVRLACTSCGHPPSPVDSLTAARAWDVWESGRVGYLIFVPIKGFDKSGLGGYGLTSEFWVVTRRSALRREISKLISK